MIAVRDLPQLTTFGIGVHYRYYRQGQETVDLEIKRQQAELSTEHALRMIACCADWIKGHRREIDPCHSSYFYKHAVEHYRRDGGDLDPYVHNGAFIAAAVGLGLHFTIDGPNVVFRVPTLRQRINRELASDGQRLRGYAIVQTHDGPLMLPSKPRVIEENVDLGALAKRLGVL